MLENSSSQPLTVTNSSSLKGSETMVGGSITIPMDIRVVATTISISRKGRAMANTLRLSSPPAYFRRKNRIAVLIFP